MTDRRNDELLFEWTLALETSLYIGRTFRVSSFEFRSTYLGSVEKARQPLAPLLTTTYVSTLCTVERYLEIVPTCRCHVGILGTWTTEEKRSDPASWEFGGLVRASVSIIPSHTIPIRANVYSWWSGMQVDHDGKCTVYKCVSLSHSVSAIVATARYLLDARTDSPRMPSRQRIWVHAAPRLVQIEKVSG